jgi:hypothetical protein
MTQLPPRLRRREVPTYLLQKYGLTVAVSTLAKLASIGGGPAMQYSGRIPLYPLGELDVWAEGKLSMICFSTSMRRGQRPAA